MRDKRFVAIHRGGHLSPENHRMLMKWAITCFEHVLPYYGREPDPVLHEAMNYAREWSRGACLTGDLIIASRNVHRFAKMVSDPVASAVMRSIGQGGGNSPHGRPLRGSGPVCSKGSSPGR